MDFGQYVGANDSLMRTPAKHQSNNTQYQGNNTQYQGNMNTVQQSHSNQPSLSQADSQRETGGFQTTTSVGYRPSITATTNSTVFQPHVSVTTGSNTGFQTLSSATSAGFIPQISGYQPPVSVGYKPTVSGGPKTSINNYISSDYQSSTVSGGYKPTVNNGYQLGTQTNIDLHSIKNGFQPTNNVGFNTSDSVGSEFRARDSVAMGKKPSDNEGFQPFSSLGEKSDNVIYEPLSPMKIDVDPEHEMTSTFFEFPKTRPFINSSYRQSVNKPP
ncbi:hypothetical protein LOTGIDRAFT_233241, partial [Lottia gigantea]